MSSWTAEVREILAHSENEAVLRASLDTLIEAHEANPDPEPEYDYGVAWKAPRRKKWTYPSIDDYGDLEDAQKELKIMQRIPNTEAGIVRRVQQGNWEFVDGEPQPPAVGFQQAPDAASIGDEPDDGDEQ